MADLIDRQELLKHKGNCYDEEGHLLYAVGTGTILLMPTVDAEPVRHGRWIRRGNYMECSECHVKLNEYDIEWALTGNDNDPCFNYCIVCGAKMDEAREDDYEEPEINPCRGCEDYDGKGGCLSNGGCGERREDDT